MKASLLVESKTGNTWRAAELVAGHLQQERWSIAGISKVQEPDLAAIQESEIVLVGTWVHGAFVFAQAPWAERAISNLPPMSGKRIATFCTFALNPGKSVDKLNAAAGATGAYVIGGVAMNRSRLEEHSEVFASRLVEAAAATAPLR